MNKSDFRIIFMGTPEFAVASLEKLIQKNWNVVAVVTAPVKPAGRGRQLLPSPVKKLAESAGIPVLQPTNLKSPEFIEKLKSFAADLQVVVAFRMLPREVWQMPAKGTINLHASLLPDYRGAAPINWAIINGEEETGVTTFFLKHEIDEGKIILQEKEVISPHDTAKSLHDRLMVKGADLVDKTISLIFEGKAELHDQVLNGTEKTAPKLTRELCQINWDRPSKIIVDLIRGLSEHPGAWTMINNSKFKILKAEVVPGNPAAQPGNIVTDNKNFLHITSNDGFISILEIQKEGKRKLPIKEFLMGNKL